MAFQDEAADLFAGLAAQASNVTDGEAAGVQRLMDFLLAEDADPRLQAIMRTAGDKVAAIGRELLVDLGHPDLLPDTNAMMFVAIAALSSAQVTLTGSATPAQA